MTQHLSLFFLFPRNANKRRNRSIEVASQKNFPRIKWIFIQPLIQDKYARNKINIRYHKNFIMEKFKKSSSNRDIFTNICEKIGNNYNKSFSKFVTVTLLAFADRTIGSYEKNREIVKRIIQMHSSYMRVI